MSSPKRRIETDVCWRLSFRDDTIGLDFGANINLSLVGL